MQQDWIVYDFGILAVGNSNFQFMHAGDGLQYPMGVSLWFYRVQCLAFLRATMLKIFVAHNIFW